MIRSKLSRREFVKLTSAATLFSVGLSSFGRYVKSARFVKKAEAKEVEEGVKYVKTICLFCAVGCGILAKVKNGKLVGIEPWTEHPINRGKLCVKGASINYTITSPKRVRYPLIKEGGKWRKISWEEALDIIAKKMMEIREKYGPDAVFFAGSAHTSNEGAYLMRKFMAFWGSNNIDHQARICHSTTVAGLGNTWGYGAMTNNFNDMRNSKAIIFFSNPAEAHPVSFFHIMEAKRRGAKLICADPRFSRTAAVSDLHLQFRPGTDIAVVWGICHEIIKNGWYDENFIRERTYGFEKAREVIMKYPPEIVEEITGVPAEKIKEAAYILAHNKPATLQYAMGATQHEVGTQNIRAFAILQLLLGNAGKPGGGVNAFRGHDNVQGATDMCVLSHTLPSYYGLSEKAWKHWAKVWGVDYEWLKSRFASKDFMEKKGFTMSCWSLGALAGTEHYDGIDQPSPIKMLFLWGHSTPSIGNVKAVKKAYETVEMIVVVDPFPESAVALAERDDGIILLPACTQWETSGSVTNSGRQVQWRDKVIDPLYESKSDIWIIFSLVKALDKYDPGLYEKFTKNFGGKSPDEITPEEVLDKEITVGARAIGMIGQKSWRLKRQKEYDYTFDPETLRSMAGPCKGEYWGLPWPCWNERHPGTPILYRNDIPVWEGGHDFRVKWGTKAPDGESLLSGVNGHDQMPGWTTNLETDYSDWLDKNMVPSGRGRARIFAWNLPDPVPVHREPLWTPKPDLAEKYPAYEDEVYGKFHFRVKIHAKSYQMAWLKKKLYEYSPLVWTSGRQVEHHGGGSMTRNNPILAEFQPELYVEINPEDAIERGIKDGDLCMVVSFRGVELGFTHAHVVAKAKVTSAVPKGVVFLPFHWAGVFEGKSYVERFPRAEGESGESLSPYAYGDTPNILNPPGWDPSTQMQNTKAGMCQVFKLEAYEHQWEKEGVVKDYKKLIKELLRG
ncbi:molybdopterin oxidoreductase [Ferroglobus placidus DSM 10642]|uniref:Molybdopterin oxidoreductase n=1 Tax=Ferroglobus placidus (strain DSM 10642 / AEDII12DO) TaxID=589924 RepID=D3RXF4_FERPA|nr:molybdopterin-dependent oxidoreductase [Ferroglobus placidus]ADC65167.1 molybdopterin oxidoreductase [Ferroglobus placidus DSM 10642]